MATDEVTDESQRDIVRELARTPPKRSRQAHLPRRERHVHDRPPRGRREPARPWGRNTRWWRGTLRSTGTTFAVACETRPLKSERVTAGGLREGDEGRPAATSATRAARSSSRPAPASRRRSPSASAGSWAPRSWSRSRAPLEAGGPGASAGLPWRAPVCDSVCAPGGYRHSPALKMRSFLTFCLGCGPLGALAAVSRLAGAAAAAESRAATGARRRRADATAIMDGLPNIDVIVGSQDTGASNTCLLDDGSDPVLLCSQYQALQYITQFAYQNGTGAASPASARRPRTGAAPRPQLARRLPPGRRARRVHLQRELLPQHEPLHADARGPRPHRQRRAPRGHDELRRRGVLPAPERRDRLLREPGHGERRRRSTPTPTPSPATSRAIRLHGPVQGRVVGGRRHGRGRRGRGRARGGRRLRSERRHGGRRRGDHVLRHRHPQHRRHRDLPAAAGRHGGRSPARPGPPIPHRRRRRPRGRGGDLAGDGDAGARVHVGPRARAGHRPLLPDAHDEPRSGPRRLRGGLLQPGQPPDRRAGDGRALRPGLGAQPPRRRSSSGTRAWRPTARSSRRHPMPPRLRGSP